MIDRNIEEACTRIGPRFFIFLSSFFLSFLPRNAQAGDVVAVEEMATWVVLDDILREQSLPFNGYFDSSERNLAPIRLLTSPAGPEED